MLFVFPHLSTTLSQRIYFVYPMTRINTELIPISRLIFWGKFIRSYMFLPCCITTFPLHQKPRSHLFRHSKTCSRLSSTIAQYQGKMNTPVVRRTAAVIGAGALAYWVYEGKAMPSKNQTVIWGISGQLNDMNADAEGEAKVQSRLEKIYGSVVFSRRFSLWCDAR